MNNIETEKSEKVIKIWIRREIPLNPLNMDTIEEIYEAIRANPEKIVIIAGRNKAFSAGADIKGFLEMKPSDAFHFSTRGNEIMHFIAQHPMPVIAAIHGYALGGGFELALACDLRISTKDAVLGLPEVALGILPGFGGTQRMKELLGESIAFDFVSRGRKIRGEEAVNLGLVNYTSDDPVKMAEKIAEEYAALPPIALKYIKRLIRKRNDRLFEEEAEYFGKIFETNDQKEGASAFIEKRKANFTGR